MRATISSEISYGTVCHMQVNVSGHGDSDWTRTIPSDQKPLGIVPLPYGETGGSLLLSLNLSRYPLGEGP